MSKSKAEKLAKAINAVMSRGVAYPEISPRQCVQILDELNKPELLTEHRMVLQMLMDGKGNVTKVAGKWRVLPIGVHGLCCGAHTRNDTINDMIDLELLYVDRDICSHSGMSEYASVTKAGRDALNE